MTQYTLKIALAAKGDFSAESTYALLDVVRYNDASWVCRKAVTEVGEWNDENWQLLVQDGAQGTAGKDGVTPTFAIGTVTTGEAGTDVSVELTGTAPNYVLNITIPKGEDGVTPTLAIGAVTTVEAGVSASAEITGDAPNYVLNITIPKGDKGETGETGEGFSIYKTYGSIDEMNADAANVEEGKFVLIASDVEDEDNAKLYVKGAETFTYLTDLSGAQGIKGEDGKDGATPTLAIGSVTTGAEGTDASVEITGTAPNYVLNFTIPQGATGAMPTLTFNVLTGAAGTNADLAVLGVAGTYLLQFTIPRGDKGEKGDKGDPGEDGTDAVFKILTAEPSTSDLAEGEVAFVVEE